MVKRKRKAIAAEEKQLTESFVRFVKLLGPRRSPSMNCRTSLIFHLVKQRSVGGLCGLVEWYMHRKRRTWATDVEVGQRWRGPVDRWIEENRALVSAIVLTR